METLNRAASEAMIASGARAATDVTGFGLLGHLREMGGTRLGARIIASEVPILEGALDLAARDVVPGGTRTNLHNAVAAGTAFASTVSAAMQLVLADSQTSGGLLIAIEPAKLQALIEALRAQNIVAAAVGNLTAEPQIVVC